MMSSDGLGLPFDPSKHDMQYNHLYFCRLVELAPFISAQIHSRSGKVTAIKDVIHEAGSVYVIGVLLVEYPSRPSILTDVSGIKQDPNWKNNYTLFLEDQSARIEIKESLSKMIPCSTGIIVGLRGSLSTESIFVPDECFLPGISKIQAMRTESSGSIAIVSNIPSCQHKMDLLKMTLMSSRIIQTTRSVILIGPFCSGTSLNKTDLRPKRKYDDSEHERIIQSMNQFGRLISFLSDHFRVYVVPSLTDPTTASFPLAPINPLLLGIECNSNVQFCYGPCCVSVDGANILISDMSIYNNWKNMLPEAVDHDILVDHGLRTRLMCPNSPDSLCSFPFSDKDPLIMCRAPDLAVVANSHDLKHRILDDTIVYYSPSFDSECKFSLFNQNQQSIVEIRAFSS